MDPEITITDDGPEDGADGAETAAAADAARAEASASAAAEAAALALVTADAAAAAAEADAAATVTDFEGRLSECRAQLESVTQSQAESSREVGDLRAAMGTMQESLSSILSRLPPAPESRENPEPEPSAEAPPDQPPAPEPEPPARRRLHRWI